MSITTYAALTAAVSAQRDFLATIEPKERLRGWTKTGGYTYTYEIAWAPLFTMGYSDGRSFRTSWRGLQSVKENGTSYTSRASIALVDANAGSYYFDQASAKIYVRCSDDGNADRDSVWIVAFFKLYFSSGVGKNGRGKIFDGIYYEPLLSASSLPTITNEQTDFLAGGGLSFGGLELKLANHLRFFDRTWSTWSWRNAAVEILHGGEDLPLSEYALIYAGTIKEPKWRQDVVTFDTINYLEILKRNIPVNPCFGADVAEEDRGKPLPLLIGEVYGIKPLCTNARDPGSFEYTIADPAFQTLKEVVAVYDESGAISTDDYSVDLTNCRITFLGYTPAGELTVWAKGAKISDIPGESSDELLENPADVVRFLLKAVLGLDDSSLNTASFAAAHDALVDLPVCKYIRFRRNLATYISELERSTLSVLYQANDGKIGLAVFDPFFTSSEEIVGEEISSFEQISPSSKLYAGVKIGYNPRPYDRAESGGIEGEDDAYDVVVGENSGARYLDGQETAYRRITSWLRTQAAAETLRDRILFLTNRAPIELEIEAAGARLFARKPGDVLSISRAKAPTTTGSLEAQMFQILSIEKRLAENKATLKLDNLNGAAYLVGQWCGDTAPAWSSASTQEKLEQGFWTDDNGLTDPGDWATADQSAWW